MISQKRLKALIYDPLYIARNSLLFLFGTVLYFVVTGVMNQASLLALLGFILAYNSVYYLNDLKDYDEDKEDKYKLESKPLLNGSLTKKEAVMLYFFYLITGLAISFSISMLFGIIVLTMLILNILHSFIFKKIYLLLFLNMILIQTMKVTVGWIAVSPTFENFPVYFIFFLGASYSLGYLIYKKEKSFVEVNKKKFGVGKRQYMKYGLKQAVNVLFGKPINMIFSLLTFGSMIASYFIYTFKLHILLMMIIAAIFSFLQRYIKGERFHLYTTYHMIIVSLYTALVITFFIASYIPELVALNMLL